MFPLAVKVNMPILMGGRNLKIFRQKVSKSKGVK
jgi:hypothetical protein